MFSQKGLFFLAIFFLFLGAGENVCAQRRTSPTRKIVAVKPPPISAEKNLSPDLARRLETFNFVWQTIGNNYFDQTFSGVDWKKIKVEFEPRILKTTTDAQLYDLLQEMINRLNRSHFAIIPPEIYQAIEKAKTEAKAREKRHSATSENSTAEEIEEEDEEDTTEVDESLSGKFGIGIELRLIDERFVVTRIEKNSAAENAGLKTGSVIEKINGVSLDSLLQKIAIYSLKIRNFKRYLPAQIVEYMLDGKKDGVVSLTCFDETGQPKEFNIRREPLKGSTISIGKNFPEQFLKFESSALDAEVGFIKFNLFALPVIEKFCRALTDLKDKKAIIIDLRGNSGGILGTMIGLSGMLTEKSIDLGTSIYKVGSENTVAFSKPKNYKGKLVVLVDNQTVSSAEIFAAALQENNRALVVGEKTAGEALPSVSVALPTGAVLLYPIANFKTRNGNFVEGKGVEPNFVVSLDRQTLLEGKDAQLELALKIIRESKVFPHSPEEIPAPPSAKILPPPPPAPKAIIKGKILGEVNITAAPLPPEIDRKDEKSTQLIADFIDKIGGAEALRKINSYALEGNIGITIRGTKTDLGINIFRQMPDKYAEIMKSEAVGEVRQVYNGKRRFLQSDFGLDNDFPVEINPAKVEILSPIFNLLKKDFFKSLTFQGIFEQRGRKAYFVEARTAENYLVTLAFDAETKLLVGYVSAEGNYFFDDYRAVENLRLPFQIEREIIMRINLEEIKLNPTIDERDFMKKENCFDKAN